MQTSIFIIVIITAATTAFRNKNLRANSMQPPFPPATNYLRFYSLTLHSLLIHNSCHSNEIIRSISATNNAYFKTLIIPNLIEMEENT